MTHDNRGEKSMILHVSNQILDIITETISDYCLFGGNKAIIVAFSGGKDSLFTCIALRELGYEVIPVIIDMGYETNWDKKIVNLAQKAKFNNSHVLYARKKQESNLVDGVVANKIKINIDVLNNKHNFADRSISPCTFCYNTKALLLENFALSNEIYNIVFGQHLLDGIASMLKSAFMYIDRWEYNNEIYAHERFSKLIDSSFNEFMLPHEKFISSPLLLKIEHICRDFKASTDDPPQQIINGISKTINLVRPIFRIRESTIIKYVKKWKLSPEGSGCGHGSTKNSQTPREMIHYRILRSIDNDSEAVLKLNKLHDLVKLGLSSKGELLVNTRNARSALLGSAYKSACMINTNKV